MYIPRKLTATFLITFFLIVNSYIAFSRFSFDWVVMLSILLTSVIVYIVSHWVSVEPRQDAKSQRKVEKLLRELDDNDLDLLRTRLMRQERNDDYAYESMAELMQSSKRKNEVR
jgi:small-conductance mechanosensitive channel